MSTSQNTPELDKALRYFKVTSYITGVFLLVISVLYALRLSISSDLWIGGPQGLISLAQFSVDPSTGERIGLEAFGPSNFAVFSQLQPAHAGRGLSVLHERRTL